MSEFIILVIEKDGSIIEKKVKTIEKLYSVCNYRNNSNFELLYKWNLESTYELYGKKKGKTSCENKVKLPNPLTEDKFFGTLCIVKKINNTLVNITLSEWSSLKIDKEKTTVIDEKELLKEEYEDES